jgi:hypothetical protein
MGIALLIVAALVAYMLWSNPEMFQAVTGAIWSRFGQA